MKVADVRRSEPVSTVRGGLRRTKSRRGCWALIGAVALLVACGSGENPEHGTDAASRSPEPAVTGNLPVDDNTARPVASAPEPADAGLPLPDAARRGPTDGLTRNTNDLISELEDLAWDEQSGTGNAAEALLRRLRAEGANALVPIRDWLLERDDAGAAPEALRLALLDTLLSLRLPEVEDIALELLATAPSGAEVWRLGRYLESAQPGRYADLIRSAAELALVSSDPAMALPPELFDLLGLLGNQRTAEALAQAPQSQEVYASLALADLPDGRGLPALVRQVDAFQAGRDTMQGRLALQLLAQQAARYPEAASVLIDLAKQGLIPQDLWPYLLDIVAGNWALTLFEPPAELLVGSHTYYHPGGDQVIYRAAPDPYGVDDGLNDQRLYLLDRLRPLAPPDLVWGANK